MLTLLTRRLPFRVEWWRDADSVRRGYGFALWGTGGEIRTGIRMYRWRYVRRG